MIFLLEGILESTTIQTEHYSRTMGNSGDLNSKQDNLANRYDLPDWRISNIFMGNFPGVDV